MINDAVILMAGIGSRLRSSAENVPKPLIQIAGRALFSYIIGALHRAGIENVHVIIGYNGKTLLAGLKPLVPPETKLQAIHNPEWQKGNGISVLAAKSQVRAPFLLMMGDHLFDPAIVDLVIRSAESDSLNVAVDRKISAIFDLADAMKIKTDANRVIAIGKDLRDFDAIDTGVFVASPEIFVYLERAKGAGNGDCSLADGVRAMARDRKVRAIDIGEAWWQDIDTPEMLVAAQKIMRGSRQGFTRSPAAP
jgi:1L-myo-inositol 1-phosphate cytidylyltransferase